MSDARRGIPLLSEPPPTLVPPDSEIACRKCNKDFHFFVRSRKCNHCGYSYCHTCSDFQALMPRPRSDMGGYESMNVCGFCIEFLNITAAGRNALKSLPLGKLKKYAVSYGIGIDRAVEKDDIIDAIMAVRGTNGCLPPANEDFYRKYSVPNRSTSAGRSRGLFSRSGQGSSSDPPRDPPRPASGPYEFPRPDLQPDVPFQPTPGRPPSYPSRPQQQHDMPPGPIPNSSYAYTLPHHHQHSHHELPPQIPTPRPSRASTGSGGYHQGYGGHVPPTPSYMTRPPQQQQQQPAQSSNHHAQSSPPRAVPYSSLPPRPVSVGPPPNLDQLVEMGGDSIGSLSISALKSILFTNHVTTGLILEKGDLVKKVLVLVDNEKAERARQRQMEEREEMERLQRAMETMHGADHFNQYMEGETERGQSRESDQHDESDFDHHSDGEHRKNETDHDETSHSHSASPPHPKSSFERPGMCVICQDEDANIAIIDCGHMAMCRGCSELVMASSKECPLCRTRIVTEARLLRIYRT